MGLVTFERDDAPGWQQRLLSDSSAVHMAFQPIVDLARGLTTGYEALARVTLEPADTPDGWLRRAAAAGFRVPLEAVLIERALETRALLPPNCFLTVNVSPSTLMEVEARRPFAGAGDLRGIVVELTEDGPIEVFEDLDPHLEDLRARGALIAVDDAGAGYAGLQRLLRMRPSLVKLDRSLITGIDSDQAKQALVRMLGGFVGEIDSWLLAEGIETAAELETLISLGVPLGQGYFLGRPGATFAELPEMVAERIRRCSARAAGPGLLPLTEPAPTVSPRPDREALRAAARRGDTYLAAIEESRRPVGLYAVDGRLDTAARAARRMLTAQLSEDPAALVLRSLARAPDDRLAPIVMCDFEGRYIGLATIGGLVREVARESLRRAA